mmetsp:Transcript_7454/g.14579  ORF Transcript_7454/g.14579 Transcript_7454/m.14579 type:complete len:226 (+) Transcript_7454:222-899(+)
MGKNEYRGFGRGGLFKFMLSKRRPIPSSIGLGHSSTKASSGSTRRMKRPFFLVPAFTRTLKACSIVGAPGRVRTFARPVIIILLLSSNSTLLNSVTCVTGAMADAIVQSRPLSTAKSSKSRNERIRRLKTSPTSSRRPASISDEFMISDALKDPAIVIVKGSKMSGPPGVMRFTTGTPPNANRRKSNFRPENVIEPSDFAILPTSSAESETSTMVGSLAKNVRFS